MKIQQDGKAVDARKFATEFSRLQDVAGDQESGDKAQVLAAFAPGSRVASAALTVGGRAFAGKLRFLKGAKATPSPVVYGTDGKAGGSDQGFIVDFTGVRSVLKLGLDPGAGSITLVLPWLGTDFSNKAAYPVTDPVSPGQFLPKADADGAEVVAFTGLEAMKLLVQLQASSKQLSVDQFVDNCLIATATYPSNVKASINGRLPFWSHPGVLNETVPVTGLAEDLNALLQNAAGLTEAKLLLTTDMPGVLEAAFDTGAGLSVESSADARWGGQNSLEVALAALETQPVALSFPAETGKTWLVERVFLQLSGQFPPWRAYWGQADTVPGRFGMTVSAQFSVARRLIFAEACELYGIALLLRCSGDAAELKLELVAEQDDQPAAGKPLASADLPVAAQAAGELAWHEVLFASPLKRTTNDGIWLVAKARTGSVEWVGSAEPQVHTRFNNEGGQWQRYPAAAGGSPTAQIKLLRRPFVRENEALLDLSCGGQQRSLDLAADSAAQELTLAAPLQIVADTGGNVAVQLDVTARASGSLRIVRATTFYRESNP